MILNEDQQLKKRISYLVAALSFCNLFVRKLSNIVIDAWLSMGVLCCEDVKKDCLRSLNILKLCLSNAIIQKQEYYDNNKRAV